MAAVLLLTLLSLSTIILSLAERDISIDCGALKSYVDDSNKVTWVGDNGFVKAGKSFKLLDKKVPKPFKNLRYFPYNKTNCYTNIPATKGRKTLVRTGFYYGNYDNKSSPPSFNVVYDRKHLDSVVNVETLRVSEVIFAPASENISVCLVRTSADSDPFISYIEVYSLDARMYDSLGPDEGLIFRKRSAYAAEKYFTRYPSDPYGRLWSPLRSNESTITELKTAATSINISGASNKPPETVMSKAWSNASLTIPVGELLLENIPFYLALYFSEPQILSRTQTRSFNIFFDSKQVDYSGPLVPVFGEVIQVVVRDVVATSKSKLLVQSTKNSTLPPIMNAFELYWISTKSLRGQIGSRDDEEGSRNKPGKKKPKEVPTVKPIDEATAKSIFTETMKNKKPKLPLILGVTLPTTFVALLSACAAFFVRKRSNAKPQPNTLPATSKGNETGTSPLFGQQLASDVSHPPRTG